MSKGDPDLMGLGLNMVHRKRIERFDAAVRQHDNMGAVHPEDHPAIEAEYKDAKRALAQTFVHLYNRLR